MVRIGLVLASPRQAPLASTRVALLQVLPLLAQQGLSFELLHEPEQAQEQPLLDGLAERAVARGLRAVVFQKVHGASAVTQALQLRAHGIATLFMVCDHVLPQMVQACDRTVVVCAFLRSLYPPALQARMDVVHDGIERPECRVHALDDAQRRGRGSWLQPLRAVLVSGAPPTDFGALGLPPAWARWDCVSAYPARRLQRWRAHWQTQRKLPALERLAHRRLLGHPHVRFLPWSEEGVYAHLAGADLGLIPTPLHSELEPDGLAPMWQRKSENRLTLMMAMGLPVVAGPVPAYLELIESGRNAYLARTPQEWRAALQALREPAHRQEVGARARATVLERYAKERQAGLLLAALQGALQARSAASLKASG